MRRATDVGFTLVERIAQWEREYGANIAVRDRETTYTYTELFDAARRFASCLASEGDRSWGQDRPSASEQS